jgi:hypothetical protein
LQIKAFGLPDETKRKIASRGFVDYSKHDQLYPFTLAYSFFDDPQKISNILIKVWIYSHEKYLEEIFQRLIE